MEDRFTLQGDRVVMDKETGLMWQRGASQDRMVWGDGASYLEALNESKFAGFQDWRMPTKEELETLVLPEENRVTGLYLDSLFDNQRNVWSSTESGHHRACYVDFYYGETYTVTENYANHFIRAVRKA